MDLNIHQSTSKGLAAISGQPTMTSLEIAKLTGKSHPHVLRDIREMIEAAKDDPDLDHQLKQGLTEHKDDRGYTSHFDLNRFSAELLITGYDIVRRARVLSRLIELEREVQVKLPSNYIESLEALLKSEKEKQVIAYERDEAIRTKAQIGSNREASAMATASAARREAKRLKDELGKGTKQATIAAVGNATAKAYPRGSHTPLRRWCVANGVTPNKVPDDRYGEVVAWPADAWLACFDVDLTGLFGGKE